MKSRKRLSRRASNRKFKRGARVNKRNNPSTSSRGGIRLWNTSMFIN